MLTQEQAAEIDCLPGTLLIAIWEDLLSPEGKASMTMSEVSYMFSMNQAFRGADPADIQQHIESNPTVAAWIRDREKTVEQLAGKVSGKSEK